MCYYGSPLTLKDLRKEHRELRVNTSVAGSINPQSLPVCMRKRGGESGWTPERKEIKIRPVSGCLQ